MSRRILDGECIRLLRTFIPSYKKVGETAKLICKYHLEGDTLYSVKWFKGDDEFFRYVPKEKPPLQGFPLPGVAVDVSIV